MNNIQQYRDLAGRYHGGHWSALYAFASSGTVTRGLTFEVDEALQLVLGYPDLAADKEPLQAFLYAAYAAEDELIALDPESYDP